MTKNLKKMLCCPVCHADLVFSKYFARCTRCNKRFSSKSGCFQFLTGLETPDVSTVHSNWDSEWSKFDLSRNYKTHPTVVANHKALIKYQQYFNGLFIDIGCGMGWDAAMFAEKGIETIGVDISLPSLQRANALFKKNSLNGSFIQANLQYLPFKDRSVSFLYAGMSMYYVKNIMRGILEAARVLRRGGRIVTVFPVVSISTISYHQLEGDIISIPFVREFMEYVHVKLLGSKYMRYGYSQTRTVSSIRKMLKSGGLETQEVAFFPTHYPLASIPAIFRDRARKILKYRPFWPLAVFEAVKKS